MALFLIRGVLSQFFVTLVFVGLIQTGEAVTALLAISELLDQLISNILVSGGHLFLDELPDLDTQDF